MKDNGVKLYRVHIGKAECAVDLGDGSERGEYVNQDYILNTLGRPMRSISLMYCYYPLDKGWPGRASVVHAKPEVNFAWGYPYDDYFTYRGGIKGDRNSEPFNQMKEIRRHGEDVTLTLTIDPHLDDSYLRAVAEDLKEYGRVFLRINHEATGNWFEFTKRSTYKEIADFYVRFCKILNETAPNVKTILCTGGVADQNNKKDQSIEKEEEFKEAVKTADIWSIDRYFSLHWGWPYDVALKGGNSFNRYKIEDVFDYMKKSYARFTYLNGGRTKPIIMSELNADGDVTGPFDQVEMVRKFIDMIKHEKTRWFAGFSFYQFRDRGRLGLEIEDPNNSEVGIRQPIMGYFKKMIHEKFFSPKITVYADKAEKLPINLRWGNSEDADGIAIPLHLKKNPHFCEITFEENLNLMIEFNGRWFYKSASVKTIDLMEAFYEKPLKKETEMTLKLFAPPADGVNDLSLKDGADNSYTVINRLPKIRIDYEPVIK